MKPLKLALRIWFTIISVLAFMTGWALLSHAPKPAPFVPAQNTSSLLSPGTSSQVPTLPPVPSLSSLINNSSAAQNVQPLPSMPSVPASSFAPSFRTRGS